MKFLLAYTRLFFFLSTMAVGIMFCMINALFGGDYVTRNMKIRQAWIRFVAPWMGIRISKKGVVPKGACLFISNHRSFLDPVIALYYASAWPLAKAEINRYPLIGYGTRLTGILFVDRNSARSRSGARDAIARVLARGEAVLVYAEGTTNTGDKTMPFKGGSLKVAMNYNIPIVPVAIEYRDTGDHWGGTSLLAHYVKQMGKWRTSCGISFGPPMDSSDHNEALKTAQEWVNNQLLEFRREFDDGHK